MDTVGQTGKPKYKAAQHFLNKIMTNMVANTVLNKSTSNWKFRVKMQPFFGKTKGDDTVIFRRPYI